MKTTLVRKNIAIAFPKHDKRAAPDRSVRRRTEGWIDQKPIRANAKVTEAPDRLIGANRRATAYRVNEIAQLDSSLPNRASYARRSLNPRKGRHHEQHRLSHWSGRHRTVRSRILRTSLRGRRIVGLSLTSGGTSESLPGGIGDAIETCNTDLPIAQRQVPAFDVDLIESPFHAFMQSEASTEPWGCIHAFSRVDDPGCAVG